MPESVAFPVLVAVTVALPVVAAAVNRPAEVMEPALADHLTEELPPIAPETVAVHCEDAPGAMVAGLQTTEIDELEGDAGCVAMLLEPPQPASKTANGQTGRSQKMRQLNQVLFVLSVKLLTAEAPHSSSPFRVGKRVRRFTPRNMPAVSG